MLAIDSIYKELSQELRDFLRETYDLNNESFVRWEYKNPDFFYEEEDKWAKDGIDKWIESVYPKECLMVKEEIIILVWW